VSQTASLFKAKTSKLISYLRSVLLTL